MEDKMGLVRLDPFRGFDNVAKKMNNLLNDAEKGFSIEYGSFAPRVDILEDDKHLFVQAELPGVKKEDVKVTVNEENVLYIKGEKKNADVDNKEDKEKYFVRVERNYGSFVRSFMLPDNILADSIKAKFENGVLDITLEKKEPEKPKEINVEIA
eukprot:Anaeramoba_ignava/a609580_14.p2 GENE.a609580_14~~a609580_14.p2  ORF type:complete len:154 (+),score=22.59 a609580_14:497-958(+)